MDAQIPEQTKRNTKKEKKKKKKSRVVRIVQARLQDELKHLKTAKLRGVPNLAIRLQAADSA